MGAMYYLLHFHILTEYVHVSNRAAGTGGVYLPLQKKSQGLPVQGHVRMSACLHGCHNTTHSDETMVSCLSFQGWHADAVVADKET